MYKSCKKNGGDEKSCVGEAKKAVIDNCIDEDIECEEKVFMMFFHYAGYILSNYLVMTSRSLKKYKQN